MHYFLSCKNTIMNKKPLLAYVRDKDSTCMKQAYNKILQKNTCVWR